nr:PREDICTED: single Ig IL-1-related receptor [Equus przewalskii]
MAGVCDRAPDFLSPSGNQVLWPALGSVVTLNCTAWVVSGPHCPLPSVQWLKDGLVLGNESHYDLHEDSWIKSNLSEVLASSVLGINLTSTDDYGAFTCSIQNASSSSFTLRRAGSAGHVAAVLASLLVLLALLLAALLYVKCRLNVLLWYQDAYGEVEMNGEWGMDGRELWGSLTTPHCLSQRHSGPRPGWEPPGSQCHLEEGVRGPIFGEPSAPPQASGVSLGEARGSEVDISDLGSRNYSARTDFYCLVSEDDV